MKRSLVGSVAIILGLLGACGSDEAEPGPTVQIAAQAGTSSAGGASGGSSGSTSSAGGSAAGTSGGGASAAGTAGASAGGSAGAANGGSGTSGAAGSKAGTGGSAGAGNAGTAGTTASAGSSGAAGAGTGGAGGAVGTGGSGGGATDICAGVASATFEPPTVCDGPSGNTSTQVPSNGVYATSWFGCYAKPDGTIVQDPSDNCEFACGSKGLCPSGQSGPECEAGLKWFAADADRYGCGARIRLINCENGKRVVVATLDRGPNCGNEMSYGVSVIDMSHDAMIYLFDGATYGGSDKQRIVVEPVDAATPLGPEP